MELSQEEEGKDKKQIIRTPVSHHTMQELGARKDDPGGTVCRALVDGQNFLHTVKGEEHS